MINIKEKIEIIKPIIKKKIKDITNYITEKTKTLKENRPLAVIYSAIASFIIMVLILIFVTFCLGEVKKLNGFWTLITLIISSPIAFTIWHFRDQNAIQQIENARKDTNLKEFQKLAEWVSGAHLIEDKIIEKSINQNDDIETIREYTNVPQNLSIPTYSKKDGAVGLQISAVYNLLPFYRGEHGESFKKPALNLLTSAWLSLQQKELENLEKLGKGNLVDKIGNYKKIISKIQQNAKSPLGIAITRVLLSLNQKQELCLLEHKEVFPNLVLAGMDFHLSGLDEKVLNLFQTRADYSGINLIGANLQGANLQGANLQGANLQGAKLQGAKLQGAKLQQASLQGAELQGAELQGAELQGAELQGADLQMAELQGAELRWAKLQGAKLQQASLQGAKLQGADLQMAKLQQASLKKAELRWAELQGADLQGADLQEADLQEAYLIEIDLQWAKLQRADFQGANLQEAKFHNSNLEGTNFTNAEHLETVDFTGAQNLDKAIGLPPEIVEKFKQKTEN